MKKNVRHKSHIFAMYVEKLSHILFPHNNFVLIQDEHVVHRLKDVLRLGQGDFLYLFDEKINIYGTISVLQKKTYAVEIIEKKENRDFQYKLVLYLPLLKKAALEEAVYNATEMGISEIQLIKTDHSQKNITDHEFLRLEKMVIAACQQAKRFNIPQLKSPLSFEAVAEKKDENLNIWFDPNGLALFSLCSMLESSKPKKIGIFIGPEADFSKEERETLQQISKKYTLTPTVLRSVSAVTLSIGSIRSILSY
jgi:16S rRNA (uracil1498-N3)-methyltransferase